MQRSRRPHSAMGGGDLKAVAKAVTVKARAVPARRASLGNSAQVLCKSVEVLGSVAEGKGCLCLLLVSAGRREMRRDCAGRSGPAGSLASDMGCVSAQAKHEAVNDGFSSGAEPLRRKIGKDFHKFGQNPRFGFLL